MQIKENRNELPETIRDGLLTLKIQKIWGRVGDIQFCTQEDLCLNPNVNTTAISHNTFKRIMNTPLTVDGEWIEAIDRDREFHNELMALDLRAEAENFDSVIPLSMIAYARNLYVEEKQKRNKKSLTVLS